MTTQASSDLSAMMARVVLALLTAATVVLGGLWLRTSSALGFASTLISMAVSVMLTSALRGERIGPPTAAATRLQPLVDVLVQYPGGSIVGRASFKRGVSATNIGITVATAEQLVANTLLSHAPMATIWRGVLALVVILLPINAALAWWRSRQRYTGTDLARNMSVALRQVISPNADPHAPWLVLPAPARIATWATLRTAATASGRVLVQLTLPVVFATPVSIAFVAVATITLVAGGPMFLAIARSLRAATTTNEVTR